MTKTVPIIGVEPEELRWLRLLVALLRHPDPRIPELARQALLHVADTSRKCLRPLSDTQSPAAPEEPRGSKNNLVS